MEEPAQPIPASAKYLGYCGLIPFIACAAGVHLLDRNAASFSAHALVGYGAVILSFMGAVHWGLAVAPGRELPAGGPGAARMMTLSVVPALVGWAALWMAPSVGLLVMAVAFVALGIIDQRYSADGTAPAWYWRLRLPLTTIVVLCLLIALPALRGP